VTFSDQLPSKQWAALTFRGERVAEVWFKPEGEPLALVFRIPQGSFRIPAIGPRLTTEILLKTVAIAADEVESWRCEGVSYPGPDGPDPGLSSPLPQPPPGVPHLEVHVRLKPPAQAAAPNAGGEPGTAVANWHDLEARWRAILGLEATVDTLRRSVEGARAEVEAAVRRALTAEEKTYALATDVAQWTRAKSRAHYTLPKANDFIHRATWAAGTPERKRLGELFKEPVGAHTFPEGDEVLRALESLGKDRQVLSAQGVTVCQECKAVAADIQTALRQLQSNATARASAKKGGARAKGKSF
jgi:hypothetical protein